MRLTMDPIPSERRPLVYYIATRPLVEQKWTRGDCPSDAGGQWLQS